MSALPNESKHVSAHDGDTDFTVHRSHASRIVAALLCILLAVAVWLVVIQLEHTDTVKLSLKGAPEQYACVLSDTMIDVKGTVLDLKKLDAIEVICPAYISAPGTYLLKVSDLQLPDGVMLAEELVLTLTVLPK